MPPGRGPRLRGLGVPASEHDALLVAYLLHVVAGHAASGAFAQDPNVEQLCRGICVWLWAEVHR